MSSKPAIVLAPGAWHVPQHMSLLKTELEKHGYEITVPSYASIGGKFPTKDALADFEIVNAAARKYIDAGKDVCMAMFSYGGIVGTGAAHGLRPHETPNGKGVTSLAYIAAFVPDVNETLFDLIGRKHAPWARVYKDVGACGWMAPDNPPFEPGHVFYNDCSPEVQDEHVGLLRLWSEAANHTSPPSAAWKDIESNYLICEMDQALPVPVQENHLAGKAGGKWKRIERIQAGHSPFLSRPRETALFIRRCAGEEV